MTNWIFAAVSPDVVPDRHYFLEAFQSPQIIWGIRVVFILGAVAALIIYRKMKDKNGE